MPVLVWMMRTLVTLVIILALQFIASPVLAWGPKAHTEIGQGILNNEQCPQEIVDNPSLFLLGSILPDIPLSLALSKGYDDPIWVDRQIFLHSDQFVDVMVNLSITAEERAFVAGWIAHVTSDKVEVEYSKRKMQAGAPVAAEFPVDTQVHAVQGVTINTSIRNLIQEALNKSGGEWQVSAEEWNGIEFAYNMYFSPFYQMKLSQYYGEIAEEWYSDYQTELAKSVSDSLIAIESFWFNPWTYDRDSSGAIEEDEALTAVADYFDLKITKAQALEVIALYFG